MNRYISNRMLLAFVILITIIGSNTGCSNFYLVDNLYADGDNYKNQNSHVTIILEVNDPSDNGALTTEMVEDVKRVLKRRLDEFEITYLNIEIMDGEYWNRIKLEFQKDIDIEKVRGIILSRGMLEFILDNEVVMRGSQIVKEIKIVEGDFWAADFAIHLNLTDEYSQIFAEITRENVGKHIELWFDEEKILNGIISEEIPRGMLRISGAGMSLEEAKRIVFLLRGGSLLIPIKEVEVFED